jgi:hypothetical protein
MAIAALTAAGPAVDDQLRAEPGIFGEYDITEYYVRVVKLLLSAKHRWAEMVVAPSDTPEEAVYLEFPDLQLEQKDCVVVSNWMLRPFHSLGNQFKTIDPHGNPIPPVFESKPAAESEVAHARAVMPRAVCDMLQRLWIAALLRVQIPPEPKDFYMIAFHGDTFHFATWQRGVGYRGGMHVHAKPATKVGDLVRIAKSLAHYARAPYARTAILASLPREIDELRKRFESDVD